ncbi:MAG TPA: histidinol-phosphatase [Pirellulales bacterium]|jgi:histidinol phosphatase-like enzyme (inositol monophosphatase family)|nr:histidinol-phosphatase [Pirellulales bacterium]
MSIGHSTALEIELHRRRELAVELAQSAGGITLAHFRRSGLQIELKADQSPVTIADREAELALRAGIKERFPQDAILGEEFGEESGTSGFRWILDPIDGTKSFIRGVPLYGTLIGVEHEARSVVGVIHIPPTGEMLHAVAGDAAFYQDGAQPAVKARVSPTAKLGESLFCTSDPVTFRQVDRAAHLERLIAACQLCRTWGDCYGYLLVATGRADLMVDPLLSVWDAAALQPILEAAGGSFTDWQGRPTIYTGDAIATNSRLLAEVLQITATR